MLAGMLLLAFVVRSWLNRKVGAPWIMGDEIIYSENAKSVADGGGLDDPRRALLDPHALPGSRRSGMAGRVD